MSGSWGQALSSLFPFSGHFGLDHLAAETSAPIPSSEAQGTCR